MKNSFLVESTNIFKTIVKKKQSESDSYYSNETLTKFSFANLRGSSKTLVGRITLILFLAFGCFRQGNS